MVMYTVYHAWCYMLMAHQLPYPLLQVPTASNEKSSPRSLTFPAKRPPLLPQMLHSLHLPPPSSASPAPTTPSLSAAPPLYLKFRTSRSDDVRYLKSLHLLPTTSKPQALPPPHTIDHLLSIVSFLKSKGFSDPDFPHLASTCPKLFSPTLDPTDLEPVFQFLALDLPASPEVSRVLVLRCPQLLFSDAEFILRPTLTFLRQLGVENLNTPNTLNAHLLNTRVEKLRAKVRFLRSVGFTFEEAARACARMPAIFGYSIDDNLRPKFDYLVGEMKRELEELKAFPQYFGFSLRKRIAPRHLHLKQRKVKVPLKRMLTWSDERFYAKWK